MLSKGSGLSKGGSAPYFLLWLWTHVLEFSLCKSVNAAGLVLHTHYYEKNHMICFFSD